jgi:hypothetical protein
MTEVLRANRKVLLHFAVLQMMDILTTLLFLGRGVAEANPLVKYSMAMTHGTVAGLLAVKLLASILAVAAIRAGRPRAIAKMNRFFMLVVGWNLIALATTFGIH